MARPHVRSTGEHVSVIGIVLANELQSPQKPLPLSHQPSLFSFRVLSTCGFSFKCFKRHLWLRVWNPRRLAPNSQPWFNPLVQTLRLLPRSVLDTFPLQWFKNSAYPQPIANCAATTTFYIARSYIISTSHRMSFKFKYILCIQTFSTIKHITHGQSIRHTDRTLNKTVP